MSFGPAASSTPLSINVMWCTLLHTLKPPPSVLPVQKILSVAKARSSAKSQMFQWVCLHENKSLIASDRVLSLFSQGYGWLGNWQRIKTLWNFFNSFLSQANNRMVSVFPKIPKMERMQLVIWDLVSPPSIFCFDLWSADDVIVSSEQLI